MPRNADGLTPLQARFAAEYVADPSSATQAAIRAGYASRSAFVAASRLLRVDKVRRVVDRKQAVRDVRFEVSRDVIVQGLLSIAEHSNQDSARVGAYMGAARILGYVVDKAKVEHTGADGGPILGELRTWSLADLIAVREALRAQTAAPAKEVIAPGAAGPQEVVTPSKPPRRALGSGPPT